MLAYHSFELAPDTPVDFEGTPSDYLSARKGISREHAELAREYGIQGVPLFVIDGKYGVSGAQEAATFANVLAQVQSEKDVA